MNVGAGGSTVMPRTDAIGATTPLVFVVTDEHAHPIARFG
jgi:hypothetical protein